MNTRTPKCSYPWCAGCRVEGALAKLHFMVNEQLKFVTREEAWATSQWNCMEDHKDNSIINDVQEALR